MYKSKTINEWHNNIIRQFLPQGNWVSSAFITGTDSWMFYHIIAEMFSIVDKYIEDNINHFKLDKDCYFLNEWYDALQMNKFIDKLPNKELLSNLYKFFLRAKRGIITSKDIEDIIKNIFKVDVVVKLYSIDDFNNNVLKSKLKFIFFRDAREDLREYAVVIYINDASIAVDSRDSYSRVIKNFLDYIIPRNYSFYYTNIEK